MTLRPIGPELYAANLALAAQRHGWPDGTAAAILALEADYPAWRVTWAAGGNSLWREPGWYAWPCDHRLPCRNVVHRKDPAAIREVLELCPAPEWPTQWEPPGGWLPLK